VSDQTKPKIDKLVVMAQGGDTGAFAQIYDELNIAKTASVFTDFPAQGYFLIWGPAEHTQIKKCYLYI